MRQVRKVVFPVAGLGTRMLPATKVLPKEMLPVVDRPIIQYALEEAPPPVPSSSSSSPAAARRSWRIISTAPSSCSRVLAGKSKTKELDGARARRADRRRGDLHTPAAGRGPGPRGLVRTARRRRRAVRGHAGR